MLKILFGFVSIIHLTVFCDAWIVDVGAYDEKCFFERMENGSTFACTFQVVEGGFLDVDFLVRDPDGIQLHTVNRESSGRIALKTAKMGKYEVCFSNRMSTVTDKRVMFDVQVAPPSASGASYADDVNYPADEVEPADRQVAQWNDTVMSVKESIEALRDALKGVLHEQEYILARNRISHRISERTNSILSWWVSFHVGMALAGVALQIIYLKKFFEVRLIV